MDDEADDQPEGKHNPGIRMAELQPPDEQSDEYRECKSFNQAEDSKRFLGQHTRFNPA
jgi:hypothetical protein